ncbi:MAG: formylglycine-generating enzyme family protein [Nitrospinota bacterium]
MKPRSPFLYRLSPAVRFSLAAILLAGSLIGTLWASSWDGAEVTNQQYLEFVVATGRTPPEHWAEKRIPEGTANEPVVLINWYDARDYCAWRGKRLPSQEEWGNACRLEAFRKKGDIWEWTRSEDEGGFKILCGPKGVCECTHRYRPEWKNAVKGFRCIGDTPVAMSSEGERKRIQ